MHYLWSSWDTQYPHRLSKNKHYKFIDSQDGNRMSPVYWQEYDPLDPDGSKAKRAALEKEILKLEADIAAKREALSKL
jgi:hypothetical protein